MQLNVRHLYQKASADSSDSVSYDHGKAYPNFFALSIPATAVIHDSNPPYTSLLIHLKGVPPSQVFLIFL